jgi:hypothetical protein
MFRRLVSAAIVLLLCVGITLAAEIRAQIVKVDGDKVTFKERKGKNEFGEEKTLPAAENVKVLKGTYNKETKKFEDAKEIDMGLKNEMFSSEKLKEKGRDCVIVTDDDGKKITEIRITARGKKGGGTDK